MNLILTKLLPIFPILLLSVSSLAQDIITKKDGKKIRAHIIEISDHKIKYNDFGDKGGLIFTLNRATIREIEFQSGSTIEEQPPGNDKAYFVDDKINNVKLNFSAFSSETLGLTYERSFSPNTSIEADLNIYGLGLNSESNYGKGLGMAVGFKVKIANVFNSGNYRPNHLLQGAYFRPKFGLHFRSKEISLSNGQSTIMRDLGTKRFVAFGMELGYQWILHNKFAFDTYFGFHYFAEGGGNDIQTDARFIDNVRLGDLYGKENQAISAGLKVGYLFGVKERHSKSQKRRKK